MIDRAVNNFFDNHVLKFNALGRDIALPRNGELPTFLFYVKVAFSLRFYLHKYLGINMTKVFVNLIPYLNPAVSDERKQCVN